jgi:hypothetical protein
MARDGAGQAAERQRTLAGDTDHGEREEEIASLSGAPDVSAKLKEARTADRKFEDVVKDAEQAAVLVLVY